MKTYLLYIGFALLVLAGCDRNRVFEGYYSVDGEGWDYADKARFEVHVPDTSMGYTLYLSVRHTGDYRFRNLWTVMYITPPSGQQRQERVEVKLAEKSGRWYGAGVSDIWEVMAPVRQGMKFEEAGVYVFELEQHMRQNPLKHVLGIGVRLEQR